MGGIKNQEVVDALAELRKVAERRMKAAQDNVGQAIAAYAKARMPNQSGLVDPGAVKYVEQWVFTALKEFHAANEDLGFFETALQGQAVPVWMPQDVIAN